MIPKLKEKEIAINLRKQGFSYSEILKRIPVAKSSLSLWLRSVGLSKKQNQRLTEKKLAAALRGAMKKKEDRILRTKIIKEAAEKEIGKLTERERWLIGIALYWAEGSKERDTSMSTGIRFNNSDPSMIKLFLKWLRDIMKISEEDIKYDIYIHENSKNKIKDVVRFWANITSSPKEKFKYIYLKKNKIKTNRKNMKDKYFGLLRVAVRKSSSLNRKISGWVEGICKS